MISPTKVGFDPSSSMPSRRITKYGIFVPSLLVAKCWSTVRPAASYLVDGRVVERVVERVDGRVAGG